MIQRTLVLLKPDAVQRQLVGQIIERFERVGLKIAGIKMVWPDKDFAKKHYAEHVGKPFYKTLESYLTEEGPIIAMVLEGVEAISVVRKIVGSTEPSKAMPGTIRGDFAMHSYAHADSINSAVRNLIHASDSEESAKREINLWFSDDELFEYKTVHEKHVF